MDARTLTKLSSLVERAEAMIESVSSSCVFASDCTQQLSHVELEARLGYWNKNEKRFETGVDRLFMERSLNMLTSFDGWSRITPWSETQDLFYEDKNGKQIRTTVLYDDQNHVVLTRHLTKKVFESQTLLVEGCENPDLRISLAVEEEIHSNFIPEIVQPHHVRIKQRKSFYYTPLGFSEPIWVFDMTLSWSGNSKSETEKKQYSEAPVYEIECECLSPFAYRLQKQERRVFVANSILLKLLDLYYPVTDPPSVPNAKTLLTTIALV